MMGGKGGWSMRPLSVGAERWGMRAGAAKPQAAVLR